MIELTDIHKSYGETEVLCGVSLEVARGEVCVLLGPSGSGKSTLLRMINGLESFDRGRLRMGEFEIQAGQAKEPNWTAIRRRVGMVFQQFHLFPHWTVLQNVTEAPRRVLGLSREVAELRAKELLGRVGMEHKVAAKPATLSGGQQQRVAIARALAMQPDVLLFDEPTSALDPQSTQDVVAVMEDLAANHQTMVVVTHDMRFARDVAHRVHLMGGGRVVESAPPAELFTAPRTEFARAFLSDGKSA